MKRGTFVALDLSEFTRPRKFSFRGMEYVGQVSPADLPEGFFVEIDEEQRRLAIRYHYFAAPNEPLVRQEVGNSQVELGRHSKRIFSLVVSNIDVGKALSVAEGAKILRDILMAVFKVLAQLDSRPGVQVGYEAACAGLTPTNEVTPPWMIEALQVLRADRHSMH